MVVGTHEDEGEIEHALARSGLHAVELCHHVHGAARGFSWRGEERAAMGRGRTSMAR
jgi:hypothetical protein